MRTLLLTGLPLMLAAPAAAPVTAAPSPAPVSQCRAGETIVYSCGFGKSVGSGALRYTDAGVWTSAHDHHTLSWWPAPVTGGAAK